MKAIDMKRLEIHDEIISKHYKSSGKMVIDVNYGTGYFARWTTTQGASVIGIDTPEMVD